MGKPTFSKNIFFETPKKLNDYSIFSVLNNALASFACIRFFPLLHTKISPPPFILPRTCAVRRAGAKIASKMASQSRHWHGDLLGRWSLFYLCKTFFYIFFVNPPKTGSNYHTRFWGPVFGTPKRPWFNCLLCLLKQSLTLGTIRTVSPFFLLNFFLLSFVNPPKTRSQCHAGFSGPIFFWAPNTTPFGIPFWLFFRYILFECRFGRL